MVAGITGQYTVLLGCGHSRQRNIGMRNGNVAHSLQLPLLKLCVSVLRGRISNMLSPVSCHVEGVWTDSARVKSICTIG